MADSIKEPPWNRCDQCGQFIAIDDFDSGAVRRLVYPDSEYTRETWETLCTKHATLPSAQHNEERR
jgi:hypothetical protein